jgi:hypothetical protein
MARYRKYPTYEPKIRINEEWAEKLKKLNGQQLTLQIKQIIDYEKAWTDILKRYQVIRCIILDATSEVSSVKRQLQKEILESNILRNYIYDSGNTPKQNLWIEESLRSNAEIRNLINLALDSVNKRNKMIVETNNLVEDINKFFIDAGWQSETFESVSQTQEDFYNDNVDDKFLFTPQSAYIKGPFGSEMQFKLREAKSSFYEIRKQINKKEKSAKLASYEDKSRNVGQSLMSSMKANLKSPYHCPYCNKKTAKTKLHVDHINPVSNGGLSVERNLVPVCSECNLDKSDLSLRAFCKKNKLDFESICDTLESMGKFI